MSDKKERNTIITDWLEKYGDPEIDKKVEERLEQITREIMSDKKQSSVEWLYNKMYEHRGNITMEEFEQAKSMHKEEIENAWINSLTKGDYHSSEEYYNGTFGGQDNEK